MRALTLIRPMSAAIVWGSKRIENRPMNLPRTMRGVPTVVAVHAGKKWDGTYERVVEMIDGRTAGVHERRVPWYHARLHDEGIVGLMLLSGRVFTDADKPVRGLEGNGSTRWYDPWYSGPFGYEILAAVAFPGPLACRGMQGFWPVPPEIEEVISMSGAIDDLHDLVRAA
jgi:hypothetical protein